MAKKLDYKTFTGNDLIKWCQDNDKVEWLKACAPDYENNFIALKRHFFKTFAPECIPVAKPKHKTLWERIEEL